MPSALLGSTRNFNGKSIDSLCRGGTLKSHLLFSIVVATLSGVHPLPVFAQQKTNPSMHHPGQSNSQISPSKPLKLNMPGPDVQNLMLGTWSTKVDYPRSPDWPDGGTAEGIEVWRSGPGGYSVIEEYYERKAKEETEEFSPAWWDAEAGGQRFVFCGDAVPDGCYLSRNVAKWEGNRNVYSEDREEAGKKITVREVFEDITPASFSQILSKGSAGGELKPTDKIKAMKLPTTVPLEKRSLSSGNLPLTIPGPPEQTMMLGTWSITEKYETDEWTPKGGVGHGEEVWRPGPGGRSIIEEYYSTTPNGESTGLAVSWWDQKTRTYQGLWCSSTNTNGCRVMPGAKWEGKQLVIENKFERNGKKCIWHEVFSDITPTSFTQTADIGESGSPLRRWLTIHATRAIQNSK